jgi:hypothetical protein
LIRGSMQINQRIVGDVAIVEVIGEIVANSGDALLKDKVGSLRQRATREWWWISETCPIWIARGWAT